MPREQNVSQVGRLWRAYKHDRRARGYKIFVAHAYGRFCLML